MSFALSKLLGGIFVVGLGIYAANSLTGDNNPPLATAASTSPSPEAVRADLDAVEGRVLPFVIIGAIRNFGLKEVEAQISVSVEGGTPNDWMATAVYIAEHSIVNGAIYSQVDVYVPNPWGDNPPTDHKTLAKVYYAPNPSRSPWDEPWSIFVADRAGTLADIEYDKLGNDLLSNAVSDPDERVEKADAEARRRVIWKYNLSQSWEPTKGLGISGVEYGRGHIRIDGTAGVEESMSALAACLSSDRGTIFKGCQADRSSR
jgi:hypothetical protein